MSESTRADFARLGVPAQALAARAAPGPAEPELRLARHLWPVVELAGAMKTQLRTVATPGGPVYIGLDYGPMDSVKRALGLPMRGPRAKTLLRRLRTLEDAMVACLNGTTGSDVSRGAAA